MNRQRLKKIYLLPNVITAFALSCGLFVIFKMNMTGVGEVTPEMLTATTVILLLAAFADFMDGAIARAIKAESEFGGIFDSLQDAVSFGVAPAVVILKSLSVPPSATFSFLPMIAAIIYSLCGVLRLVRFNVSALEAKTNEELASANKKNFTGLPIPGAASAAISLNLFLFSGDIEGVYHLSLAAKTWIISFMFVFLGYCMISRRKFPSLKNLHIRVASFRAILIIVIVAVLLLYGIIHQFSLAFFLFSWGYVLLAWILSVIRLIAGKKSKTLEDFEPEPEEESDNEE